MNNKTVLQIAVLIVLAGLVFFVVQNRPDTTANQNNNTNQPTPPPPPAINPDVIVDTPQPNDLVTSPVQVKGRARGTWYFEANIPVTLMDGNNNLIAQKGFQAQSDWMTNNHVDFNDTLTFTMPTTQFGTLYINKDNPSGEPVNDASFDVPVRFW